MNRYELDGDIFLAKACCEGVLIDPQLPPDFFDTPNEDRLPSERKWWGRAFVTTHENWGHEVLSLDGGCWDRPTFKTGLQYLTLDQAVAIAKDFAGDVWGSWPGLHFPAPAIAEEAENQVPETSNCFEFLAIINEHLRAQPGETDSDTALALYWKIEDMVPQVCDFDQLPDLFARANDPFVKGYLAGIWSMRLQLPSHLDAR